MTTREINSNKAVLAIGAAGLDIVGRPSMLPEPGVSTPGDVHPSYGGVARNVAENLARLGQKVNLITAVGADPFGHHLLDYTAAAGVDVSASIEVAGEHTASYLAVLLSDNRLHFALDDMHILTNLSSSYLRQHAKFFAQAGLVFIDANLSPSALRTVFNLARRARVPVCADATSPQLARKLEPFLSQLHLLTANTNEAAILCQSPAPLTERQDVIRAAHNLVDQGVDIAVITMAEFGVCYASSETFGYIPAVHTAVLHPTGAGDALTATIIFGLMNDIPLDDSLRLGVSAASLTLRYPGAVRQDLTLELLYDQLII